MTSTLNKCITEMQDRLVRTWPKLYYMCSNLPFHLRRTNMTGLNNPLDVRSKLTDRVQRKSGLMVHEITVMLLHLDDLLRLQ